MEQEQFAKLQRSRVFRFFDRLYHLVILNIAIVLFSLLGLVVFGVYPSIFAATAVLNEALEHNEGSMFEKFWTYYKKYFLRGNFLMLITGVTVTAGYWLIFKMSQAIPSALSAVIYLLFLVAAIAVVIWNLYLPAVSVLYPGFTFKKGLLFSIVAAFTKWGLTLALLLIYGIWTVLSLLFPQFMMFVYLSSLCWFMIWCAKYMLRRDTMPKLDDEI